MIMVQQVPFKERWHEGSNVHKDGFTTITSLVDWYIRHVFDIMTTNNQSVEILQAQSALIIGEQMKLENFLRRMSLKKLSRTPSHS